MKGDTRGGEQEGKQQGRGKGDGSRTTMMTTTRGTDDDDDIDSQCMCIELLRPLRFVGLFSSPSSSSSCSLFPSFSFLFSLRALFSRSTLSTRFSGNRGSYLRLAIYFFTRFSWFCRRPMPAAAAPDCCLFCFSHRKEILAHTTSFPHIYTVSLSASFIFKSK